MPRSARSPVTGLTENEERFCQRYLENRGNGAEAYRWAYKSSASARTATGEARRILSKPCIQARLAALRDRAAQRLDVSRERITVELFEALSMVKEQKNPDAMGRIAMNIAKLHGLVDEEKHSKDGLALEALRAVGRALQAAFATPRAPMLEHSPAPAE